MESRTIGAVVAIAVFALYLYYTIWVLITPFIDPSQLVLNYFPDRYYAIAVPVFAGVLLLAATLVTLGGFLLASELGRLGDKKSKEKQR